VLAAGLYVLLLRLGLRPWLAALATAPLLLDAFQLLIEQFLMTETLFDLLIVGACALLLWTRPIPLSFVMIAGLVLALAALTRVVAVLVIVPAAVTVVMAGARPSRWTAVAALIAAFAVASLLTLGAVGRRVREFGTLKALGWRSRRVVGQVMGEAVVQGVLGGVLGIGVGVGGAFLVSKLAPSLEATVGATGAPGGVLSAGPPGAGPLRGALAAANRTLTVPFTAPLNARLFVLAIALALVGGVLAGSVGGWRAARLRPAEALRRVE
jgi:hypothetical protein